MHPVLLRQLKKEGLAADSPPPDAASWAKLLQRISSTYTSNDEHRALIERAMQLSSTEMRTALDNALSLNSALKNSQRVLESSRQEAAEARLNAEAASRAKSEFLANMSHEIRTPMTAILGYADLLLEPDTDDHQRLEYVETIRRSGDHLLGVINDILDISKIESGSFTVERIGCSPRQVLMDVLNLMRPRAAAKGLALTADCDTLVPDVIASDPVRLRQILLNLIGNAIKFTSAGRVSVNVFAESSSPHLLFFEVVDTGIGATPDQISQMFRPFSQGDNSMTRKFGGTGLGLIITKRITNLLGGDVDVRCNIGGGCTFTASIGTGDLALRAPASDASSNAPASLVGFRVLLIEDGPDNQRLLQHYLVKAGATVEIAENGRVGLIAARSAPYDLILMDMQMPEMDGYTATPLIRESGFRGPILALTAHAMDHDRQKCLAAGCDDFITKPVDRNGLIARCQHWVSRVAV